MVIRMVKYIFETWKKKTRMKWQRSSYPDEELDEDDEDDDEDDEDDLLDLDDDRCLWRKKASKLDANDAMIIISDDYYSNESIAKLL